MQRRNQLDPDAEGHSLPGHRGATMTGNRHYDDSWIVCSLDDEWRRDDDQKYERLFFLDEATALAGGFRPCNRCGRKALEAFRDAWHRGVDPEHMTAEIDRRLREEGTIRRAERPGDLPAGVIIRVDGEFHLVVDGGMRRWSFDGYGPVVDLPTRRVEVVTPPSTVATIAAGYTPSLHPSATDEAG